MRRRPRSVRFGPALPAITRAGNSSLELRAQVCFLHKAILPTVHGPELLLRRDLEVFRLEIAETHQSAKQSVAIRAVVGVQAVDAGLDEDIFRQLRLDREKLILKPAARSRAAEALAVVFQDHLKLLVGKLVDWG